jgi:hypothetical protein
LLSWCQRSFFFVWLFVCESRDAGWNSNKADEIVPLRRFGANSLFDGLIAPNSSSLIHQGLD